MDLLILIISSVLFTISKILYLIFSNFNTIHVMMENNNNFVF